MKINKLLKAFSSVSEIAEGIKNNVFKQDHIEEIAKVRWMDCVNCEHLDNKGDKCAISATRPCCGKCGCSIGLKIRSLASSCPAGKWKALVDKKAQSEIMSQINLKKKNKDANNI